MHVRKLIKMPLPSKAESNYLRKKTIILPKRSRKLDVWQIKFKGIKSLIRRNWIAWLRLTSRETSRSDRTWSGLSRSALKGRKTCKKPRTMQ